MSTDTDQLPPCPQCASEFTYEMDPLLVCPECGHEWTPASDTETDGPAEITDAVGNVLVDGDTVTVVKTLKVKGSTQPLKSGTKVRNIRLIDTSDEHNIDCKIDGFGAMKLKSSVVKKA
ncbi:hypothetical protein CATRI_09000 [Corynebacterium atrinae]|uniref:zinc ribbon domain-containing protein YjdM n=1 Tax=Corynebacterium atrinae TaxID=1336740 RepID=UPI0025B43E80|nr:zinc ribbon domain-containing protein YjdM [Corynebacterium atrinae]WJY63872.1 hypothetical protein CATRI_09000 [Corynebacterium atrinae]